MAVQNTRFTPQRRGPSLQDGAGGTSDRARARERDPVLRNVGALTEMIRLLPGGADVSGGDAHVYDFGGCDKMSVGRYRLTRQTAASTTAEPLSDYTHCEFDIIEVTAGVFTATVTLTIDDNDPDIVSAQTNGTILTAVDPDIAGATSDTRATVFVADAAAVTELAAAGVESGSAVIAVGDLVLMDAEEASNHVFTMRRLS